MWKMDSKYVKIIFLRWLEAEIFNSYQNKIVNEQLHFSKKSVQGHFCALHQTNKMTVPVDPWVFIYNHCANNITNCISGLIKTPDKRWSTFLFYFWWRDWIMRRFVRTSIIQRAANFVKNGIDPIHMNRNRTSSMMWKK